jgi:hypothetical protein
MHFCSAAEMRSLFLLRLSPVKRRAGIEPAKLFLKVPPGCVASPIEAHPMLVKHSVGFVF